MKKVFSVLCAILIASCMILSAVAESVYSCKLEAPKVSEIVVTDAEGNVVTTISGSAEENEAYIQLNSLAQDEKELDDDTKEKLVNALEILKNTSLEEVKPEYKDKEPVDVMTVSFSEEIAEAVANGATVSMKTNVKINLEKGTILPIIRLIDGEWVASEDEYAEVLEDGTVVVHVNQEGEFTFLVDPETEVLKDEAEA